MELEKVLSHDFRKHRLFKQSLVHRSYARNHNERLEFLGDAVLQLLISEYLYNYFPKVHEGQLTRMRSRLVRKETLSQLARKLQLMNYLKLGRGEKSDELSDTILANAMEAVIGALYLCQGLETTQQFIKQIYADDLNKLSASDDFSDAKTRLQEYMQARGYPLPKYQVEQATPRNFKAICTVERGSAEGTGKTKRDAEMQAARSLLSKLEHTQ